MSELSKKERRGGAVLGLAGTLAYIATGLLLTPIMLKYLGQSQFGLYQLIGAFLGYLMLIDFGISGTLTRYIAKYRAEDDKLRQENMFSMCLIIYSALGLALVLIGYCIYQNLGRMFVRSLSAEELSQAKIMFIVAVVSVYLTVLGKAYVGTIAGCERFVFSRIVIILSLLTKIVILTAILAWGMGAVAIVVAEATINLAILIVNFLYARFVLNVRFKIHYWDFFIFKEVLSYAFWLFITALVIQINFRFGGILLGIMTTTSMVAIYAVALQINTIYNMLPCAIQQVLLPKATRLVVNNTSGEELTQFMIEPCRYQLMMLGGVLTGFVLFGRQFIILWAGPKYIDAWILAVILMVPVTIPLFQNVVLSILEAKALNRTRALINLVIAIMNAVISALLVRTYGLFGPAIGTACVLLIGHGIILNLYYHYRVGLNMIVFFSESCKKILPAIIVSLIIGVALVYLSVGKGWFGFITRCMFYLALYVSLMWFYAMNNNERKYIKSILSDYVKMASPIKTKITLRKGTTW